MDKVEVYDKLNQISKQITRGLDFFYKRFPLDLAVHLKENGFVGGGCIYSMFQDGTYKDIDIFFKHEYVVKLVEDLLRKECRLEVEQGIETGVWQGLRVVITDNAISIGEFQLIKKDFGKPEDVVSRFDFKHNMFWIEDGRVKSLSNLSYLTSNKLVLNELRPRQMAGVMVRVAKYTSRGMNLSSSEMCKIILKLNEVGIEEDEMEMLNRYSSFES